MSNKAQSVVVGLCLIGIAATCIVGYRAQKRATVVFEAQRPFLQSLKLREGDQLLHVISADNHTIVILVHRLKLGHKEILYYSNVNNPAGPYVLNESATVIINQ